MSTLARPPLNTSKEGAATNGAGKAFHILMVLGKNGCWYTRIDAVGMTNLRLWPLVRVFKGIR